MNNFISAKQAAEKWKISQKRVSVLCAENRIPGAAMVGKMWIIPSDAEKPSDKRIMRNKKREVLELKPFLKWVGGKTQLLNEIQKFFPDEKCFIKYAEPMVGGGAVLFHVLSKCNCKDLYISDINPELINTYQIVKNDVDSLINRLYELQSEFLALGPVGRKNYYYEKRELFNAFELNELNAVKKASLFIFLNRTCFNGLYRVNKNKQFNVPMGDYKNPTICDEKNLRNISFALRKVQIVNGDYTLAEKFIDKNTFVYFDPPYRPITTTAHFNQFNADGFNDAEQIRLAKFVKEIDEKGAKILLSNSDPKNSNEQDDFFDELYNGFSITRVSAVRSVNSKGDKRGKINELLISNGRSENGTD